MTENQAAIPQVVRDILPEEAQKVYVEAYTRSWNEYHVERDDSTSREALAARDAWAAVNRVFVRDDRTHQWCRKGEQPKGVVVPQNHGVSGFLRGLFGRRH